MDIYIYIIIYIHIVWYIYILFIYWLFLMCICIHIYIYYRHAKQEWTVNGGRSLEGLSSPEAYLNSQSSLAIVGPWPHLWRCMAKRGHSQEKSKDGWDTRRSRSITALMCNEASVLVRRFLGLDLGRLCWTTVGLFSRHLKGAAPEEQPG